MPKIKLSEPARADGAISPRATGDRLIDAAETLYGKYGIDGVSLRQIGQAAGNNNNFAVQYHFGDAAGLIRAILAKRMPEVDARQSERLTQLEADDLLSDTRSLVDIFFRPLLEQVNSQGERAYARFISALLRSPTGVQHCKALFHLTPSAGHILHWLQAANAHVPAVILQERLRLMSIMICTSVFNRLAPLDSDLLDTALIDDALDTAAAGLIRPPRPSVPHLLKATGCGE